MNAAASLDLVHLMVAAERRHGSKLDVAIDDTAAALGATARWVRAVIRGESATVKTHRLPMFVLRCRAWLAADIERTERIIAERKMLLANMGGAGVDTLDARQGDLFLAWGEGAVEGRK